MTHHAPMGAWSSLTLGLPGGGVGIETEALGVQPSGDLIVACSHGPGRTVALPFFTAQRGDDYEGRMAGNVGPGSVRGWDILAPGQLTRTLGPAVDEFSAGHLRFRVISPRGCLDLDDAKPTDPSLVLPALLLELEIDNSREESPATAFLGLAWAGTGRLRPLEWTAPDLAGVAFQDRWALAAAPGAFTIRSGAVAAFVEAGLPMVHAGGNEGGVALRVMPGEKKTLVAAFAFHHGGPGVVQGMRAAYAYTAHFDSVEAVCRFTLDQAGAVRAAAAGLEERWRRAIPDAGNRALMAQTAQGYYANSSLLRGEDGALHWSVCEGQFAWRNTLDLAVDQLPFELAHHPSVARNVIDGFVDRYSYCDTVRFGASAFRPGGIAFTHDQGNYTSYSPPGTSGYEQRDREGVYAFMTTEQLLNGAFCAAGVALKGGEPAWAGRRSPLARGILVSMRNREDPERRDGILRAQSDRVGRGREVTTYDSLDHALQVSCGSIYIVVKTWCAALMLARWLSAAGDQDASTAAAALAGRVARTLDDAFDAERGAFPANLVEGGDSFVLAALDPLAVPVFCGLERELRTQPALLRKLAAHARTCLRPGVCLDEVSGGLRVSSTSENTWPSKVALCLAALSWLEGKPAEELAPRACGQFADWLQVSAARLTVSDQINARTLEPLGGAYYPRVVTAWTLFARGDEAPG